ncbi:MAG: tctC [Ramlibacter sp.]|jgi:tripartite-type tricarboxylate transporter receptor subunit TctC|nr:tctC [Ramlibacter sp.]
MNTRRTLLAAMALVPCLALPALAQVGDWPKRQPVKLVSVFPPGGSVDQVARILAAQLTVQLGQNVIVENRVGASGSIGTGSVANGPGDGYTYAVVFDTHGVNPSLIPNMPFDTRKDLAPVILLGTAPMVLATPVGSDYKTFGDVVAAAKAKKNVSFGSVGSGSLGHLAMALLGKSGGLEWTHVPYKGGGPLMQDAVAGHVPLSIASIVVTKPHIDSKRLRPLAVTTSKRSPDLPDVPTVAESGYAGFDAPAWWGVLASAKTPPEIVRRMNEEINKALKVPELAAKLAGQGMTIVGGPPEAARSFIDQQIDTWAVVVRENGIKAD